MKEVSPSYQRRLDDLALMLSKPVVKRVVCDMPETVVRAITPTVEPLSISETTSRASLATEYLDLPAARITYGWGNVEQ